MMRSLLARLRGARRERGNAMMEFTALGITFLVPLVYIMLAVFDVQRAYYGITAAAREGSRAYTLGTSEVDAEQRQRNAIRTALSDQRIEPGAATVISSCEGGCLESGSVRVVRIEYNVALPYVPDILGGPIASIHLESVHRTPYGQYRQGSS